MEQMESLVDIKRMTLSSFPDDLPYARVCVRRRIKERINSANTPYHTYSRHHYAVYKLSHVKNGEEIAMLKHLIKPVWQEHATSVDHPVIQYLATLHNLPTYEAMERVEPGYVPKWHTLGGYGGGTKWERPYVIQNSNAGASLLQYLHFTHTSEHDLRLIAYYPTLQHLREGREVRTSIGKYLNKYRDAFGLDDAQIKHLVDTHNAKALGESGWSVKFMEHNDKEGWQRVYNSGIDSCMQGEECIKVYAHERSTLRLAYVEDAAGTILARCIVRDDDGSDSGSNRTGWIRVYPDPNSASEGRFLLDYLTNSKYAKHTNLDGCLLDGVRYCSGSWVCPYLDYGNGGYQSVALVNINGKDYLECGGGEMDTSTCGYVEEVCGRECDSCGDRHPEDEMTYIDHSGDNICEYCLNEYYRYAYGRRYQEWFPVDQCIYCETDSEWYLRDHTDEHNVYQCQYNDDWYHIDDLVCTKRGYVNSDDAVALDHEDSEGNSYCYPGDEVMLSDGTVCHEDDEDVLEAALSTDEDNREAA